MIQGIFINEGIWDLGSGCWKGLVIRAEFSLGELQLDLLSGLQS